MPELPEVETTVRELKNKIIGRKILRVWTDFEKMFKPSFREFQKGVNGETIKGISRRGKNIIIKLSSGNYILIHQKLTGHLLYGQDIKENFVHLIFFLDKGQLALVDLRKFAKVVFSENLEELPDYKNLGPEPLDKKFTLKKFRETLRQTQGKIKKILMDQTKIAGIGNIYSDEILFEAKISPLREIKNLKEKEIKILYRAMKQILEKAIKAKGTSVSVKFLKVYRREGQLCFRCGAKIQRLKFGGRSSHFCPRCQK